MSALNLVPRVALDTVVTGAECTNQGSGFFDFTDGE